MDGELEPLAATLEASGAYRILRRIPPPSDAPPCPPRQDMRVGIVLDCETTGLDPEADHVIELGMIRFEFGRGGIGRTLGAFSGLQEPPCPIPEKVTEVTGLTDADVAGRTIDGAAVSAFVSDADLVIAHNAGFDRGFAERRWPVLRRPDWACSLRQVPWRAEGFEAMRLKLLLMEAGWFHRGHRALDDAAATLHLLSIGLPASGTTGFDHILAAADTPVVRIWAIGAPFAAKDLLKRRGFQWCDGAGGTPRAWNLETPEHAAGAELEFLREHVYSGRAAAIAVPIRPADRFTSRAGLP